MDRLFKHLDATKTLIDAIPTLIELFVDFYGEENRKHIEETFSKTTIIGYQDTDTISSLINNIKHNETKRLIKEALEENNLSYDDDNIEKLASGRNYRFDNFSIFGVTEINEFLTDCKMGPEKRKEVYLKRRYEWIHDFIPELTYEDFFNGNIKDEQKDFLPKYLADQIDSWTSGKSSEDDYLHKKKIAVSKLKDLNVDVTEENIEEYVKDGKLDIYETISKSFEEKLKDYDDFCKNNLSSYEEYVKKQKLYQTEINKKYYIKLIDEFIDELNDNDKKAFLEAKNSKHPNFSSIKGLNIFFGYGLGYTKTLDFFSSDSDEKLKNYDEDNYTVKNIKEERIKYFKYKGIDLGDDYDLYASSEECKKLWPTKEYIDNLDKAIEKYLNESNIEYYTSLQSYKDALEKVEARGLLDKDSILQPSNYAAMTTCVSTNISKGENGYELSPLMLINARDVLCMDEYVIHELNHLYELSLVSAKDGKYECMCGWDLTSGDYDQDKTTYEDTINTESERRQYELFNEIVNELLAQKIVTIMHDKGIFLFSDPNNYKDTHSTSYENSKFLVTGFLEKYYDTIIESRKNNNINIILDKVGKENFEALNELFIEFNDNFSGNRYYKVAEEIRNNIDSPGTRKINELRQRRDIILSRMEEYSKRPTIFDR